jgi:chromosomal replication initiator protein
VTSSGLPSRPENRYNQGLENRLERTLDLGDGACVNDAIVTIPLPGSRAGSAAAEEPSASPGLGGFLAGPENFLVETAVCAVLRDSPEKYNPLVLHGPSGTGKTHLAQGLVEAWKQCRHDRHGAIYVTAVDFTRELNDAISTQATDDFRAKYRQASLLALDDLGGLLEKRSAQEELVHVLDCLLATGNRVVITASAPPAEMAGLMPALTGRLSAGLSVPLRPPGKAVRMVVLKLLAESWSRPLSDAVAERLAEGLPLTIPGLLGAMMQCDFPHRLDGRELDEAAAREFLAARDHAGRPELRDIALAAAKCFGVKLSDLRSTSRRRAIVTARGAAICMAREILHTSFAELGRFFGGRDHTTALHAHRKAAQQMVDDVEFRAAVEQVRRQLRA